MLLTMKKLQKFHVSTETPFDGRIEVFVKKLRCITSEPAILSFSIHSYIHSKTFMWNIHADFEYWMGSMKVWHHSIERHSYSKYGIYNSGHSSIGPALSEGMKFPWFNTYIIGFRQRMTNIRTSWWLTHSSEKGLLQKVVLKVVLPCLLVRYGRGIGRKVGVEDLVGNQLQWALCGGQWRWLTNLSRGIKPIHDTGMNWITKQRKILDNLIDIFNVTTLFSLMPGKWIWIEIVKINLQSAAAVTRSQRRS